MQSVKQPLRNEVLVRMVRRARTVGGIILSDITQEDNSQGVVISCGAKCTSGLKRGDVVLLPEGRKFKLTIGNLEYRIFVEDAILGTIEEDM
jgi:co-chaperonin GroES (HSP10)